MPRAQSFWAFLSLAFTTAVIAAAPVVARLMVSCPNQPCERRAYAQLHFVQWPGALCVACTAYLLLPVCKDAYRRSRDRWHPLYTVGFAAVTCAALAAFILHFGNRQFGGYDFSILIDTGWRLVNGQKPYQDFVCTPPPGFYLGLKYAFKWFGASWNAQLWATAIFAGLTFIWMLGLFGALLETRIAAFFLAFAIECAAMLTLDFWWYNNITAVAATIFFLSCLVYVEKPERRIGWASYLLSLALLGLMKPNVAGMLGAGAIVLIFAATRRKKRLVALTLGATAICIMFLLLNGVSVPGMLASYNAAAAARGRFSFFGFESYSWWDLLRAIVGVIALAAPVWVWVPGFTDAVRRSDLQAIAGELLFVLAPVVSIMAMFTNGELKDVEWSVLIASGGVVLFRYASRPRPLRQFYAAFLIALIFSDIYMGVVRVRVLGIGPHKFFEWNDSNHAVGRPFFRDLRASARFQTVVAQVDESLKSNPKPVFFGPRMEFAYAAFGLPSPTHLPVWWHPGTSFAAKREPELLDAWRAKRFATLIFLKDDFIYYSPRFRRMIDRLYFRDDSRSELTIFHARL